MYSLRDTISHLKTDHLFGVVIPVDEFTVRDLLSPESTKSNTATTTTTSTTSDVLTKKITFEQFGGSKPVRPMKVRVGALLPQFIDDKFTYGDPTIKLNHRLGPNMFKKLGDRNVSLG